VPVARSLLHARAAPEEIYVRTASASVTAVDGVLAATAGPIRQVRRGKTLQRLTLYRPTI
jgi:hypothetical protein